MNLLISISTIAFSTIISFVVALYNNKRQKDLEFNYDYRRYILEKRKTAYEKIQEIIEVYNSGNWNNLLHRSMDWEIVPAEVLKFFQAHKQKVSENRRYGIWLSPELFTKLDQIENCLKELENYQLPGLLKSNGGMMRWNGKFMELHFELIEIYFNDLTTLDDIGIFKTRKIEEQKRITQVTRDLYKRFNS
jgi:hypothetical protein